jgi:hypothetical protein
MDDYANVSYQAWRVAKRSTVACTRGITAVFGNRHGLEDFLLCLFQRFFYFPVFDSGQFERLSPCI